MRLFEALAGALALSVLMACAKPADREEEPARPSTQANPSESEESPREPREVAEAGDALRDAASAVEGRQERSRQHQTVRQLRDLGVALYAWYQDTINQAGPGGWDLKERTVDVSLYAPISREELAGLLSKHIANVPATDAWGHPYELRVNPQDTGSGHVFLLRSPGRDGVFETDTYTLGAFDPNSFDDDIVFADGIPVRWPEGDMDIQSFPR
jgi:hypothetical protein